MSSAESSIRIMLDEADALWFGERVLLDGGHPVAAPDDRLHDERESPPLIVATLTLL